MEKIKVSESRFKVIPLADQDKFEIDKTISDDLVPTLPEGDPITQPEPTAPVATVPDPVVPEVTPAVPKPVTPDPVPDPVAAPVTKEQIEQVRALLGDVEVRQTDDGIRFVGKADGKEELYSMQDLIRSSQSVSTINKRFEEAATVKKEAANLLLEAEEKIKESNSIDSILDSLVQPAQEAPFDPFNTDPAPQKTQSDPAVVKEIKALRADIDKRTATEESTTAEVEAVKVRNSKVVSAFRLVDNLITEANLPPAQVGDSDIIIADIANDVGERNEEFYRRVSDPLELITRYKALSATRATVPNPSSKQNLVPSQSASGSSVPAARSSLEKIRAKTTVLREESQKSPGPRRMGQIGNELFKLQTEAEALTKK